MQSDCGIFTYIPDCIIYFTYICLAIWPHHKLCSCSYCSNEVCMPHISWTWSRFSHFDNVWLGTNYILTISLLVVVVLYLVVGSIINFQFRKLRGIEVIPNVEFWKNLPFLVKVCKFSFLLFQDGFKFTISKITGNKTPTAYQQL